MKTTPSSSKSAKSPASPPEFDDPRFERILAAAITGLCAQFERRDGDDCYDLYTEGQDELDRSEAIAGRAIQVAACVVRALRTKDSLAVFSESV
jgi:hypothetical protein